MQEHHTFLVSSEKIVAHNVVLFLPFVLGGGISLAQSVTLANVGAAMFTLAVCAIAEKITGKSLNAEVGADGTYNGAPLPFTEEHRKNNKNINNGSILMACASGSGDPEPPRNNRWQNSNWTGNNFDGPSRYNDINQAPNAILKNGYYEVNGFRFSEYYYNHLWSTGRQAPTFVVQDILANATSITADKYDGCFRYETHDWEMIYNPTTKTVHHISPI